MTTGYNKPVPVPQVESDFYWEKCKEHELWLRYDNDAQQAYFYPRDISPITFSRNTTWIKASGKATLYTYAIVHRPFHPGIRRRRAVRHRYGGARGRAHHADQHRHGRPHAREAPR